MYRNPFPPIFLAAALSACAVQPELLNSDRIEQQFGNYGIDVLEQQKGVRRSSLYSTEDGRRICRTYAVVDFIDPTVVELEGAHRAVLGGESIGSTLRSAGWRISKQTIHVGSIVLPDSDHPIARLMELDAPAILGLHAYLLVLEDDSQSIHYATIVESHHPEYLTEAELRELYPVPTRQDQSLFTIDTLLDLVLESD